MNSSIKYLLVIMFSLSFSSLFADSHAGYPPSSYEVSGGKRAPAFSEANAAAIHFLNILDNQQYSGSWLEAGGLLQDVTTKEQWAGGMKATRSALGLARSRTVGSHDTSKSLSGGTRGEFMTIKYNTQFSQNPNAVEKVVLMRSGKLGEWKVISYSVGKG